MPCGQEAAAGGEVISEAEPDAAELCFGNISGHQILNHFSFSLLYDSLIIYFISLSLTLSHTRPCISVSISSRENEICGKRENTFISYVILGSGRNLSSACFSIGKQVWQYVDLLVLLCKEDFGKRQTPGNCYQVLVLPDTELEREVTAPRRE